MLEQLPPLGPVRVFVYGSLLSPTSLLATLGRSELPEHRPAAIDGWRRSWNVVSARTFAVDGDPSGTIHRRVVLGLRAEPGARCEGVVLTLDIDDLSALAVREAACALVAVEPDEAGRAAGDVRWWTYLPRPDRVLEQASPAEPLVIEEAYLHGCLEGVRTHGLRTAEAELGVTLDHLAVVRAADVAG